MILFRFLGDFSQVLSKLFLSIKILETKSVSGISLKTQLIYIVVFLTRYYDLLISPFSNIYKNTYMSIMKIFYISFQIYVLYLFLKYFNTYNQHKDVFNDKLLYLISFVIAFLVKGETRTLYSTIDEYLYTFSMILESVAILPQLVMLQELGDAESLTSHYVISLGLYRVFYIIYFIGYSIKRKHWDSVKLITSIIQGTLYGDFFYSYLRYSIKKGKSFKISR